MSVLCVITARGGSKRIPKKNIRDFCGKPIISYSIKAALESKIFTEVMVSTDSEEIAEVAIQYGAKVPFMRSSKNSDDYAGTEDVIQEVLEKYEQQGKEYESFCCIYPTAPFITSKKLVEANNKFIDNTYADALLSVVRFSFPPQRGFIASNGYLNFKYPEYKEARSQDLEIMYHDAGQFYFVRTEAFKRYNTVIPEKSLAFELDELEVQDIDNLSDWKIAEFKYEFLHKR